MVKMPFDSGDRVWRVPAKESGGEAGKIDEEVAIESLLERGYRWGEKGSVSKGDELGRFG